MAMNLVQNDYNVLHQSYMNRYIRLNLLNFNYQTVDEISGNLINMNVAIDTNSDLRRSCDVELVVTDSSFEIKPGGKIYLNRYIQPYIGIENIYTGEIQWYNQGIYLINTPTWRFDAQNNNLSFQGLDLMSKLTGIRNGELEGIPTVIKQDESVRGAIIATLQLGGFTKYAVEECKLRDGTIQPVPYDIEVDQGSTVFDILSELRDILPQYQIYFDIDGVFHYEPIPSGEDVPVIVDDDILTNILISEDITTDFESVKNYIEIYGKVHDIDNYSTSTTSGGSSVNLTIGSITALSDYLLIGWTTTGACDGNINLTLNNFGAKPLKIDDKNYATHLDANTYYVAQYNEKGGYWRFLGHYQAQAIYYDDNPYSPFYYKGEVGRIRKVLSGGDYDNIMSDALALERAKFEIYQRCRLNDAISINMIPIPWLDVNIVISHALKNSKNQERFIVKSISVDYSPEGTMTIQASKFYPYYPHI